MKIYLPRHFQVDFRHVVYALGLLFTALNPAWAVDVSLVKIDGTLIHGEWLGSADGKIIQIKTISERAEISLHDVSQIRFHQVKGMEPQHPNEKVIFHLADGGQLLGTFVDGGEESIVCDCALGKNLNIEFDRLAGIQLADRKGFTRANELFVEALRNRLPGKDVLITRSVVEPKLLRGRLATIGPNQCSFVLSDQARNVKTEKLYGVVFATGVSNLQKDRLRMTLNDGSNLTGRWLRADADTIVLNTSMGTTSEIPIKILSSLDYTSERVVYLGDIDYVEQHTRGRLHRGWPVRFNQNVAGEKISIHGRSFQKGIGCHSFSEIKYKLDGQYETFVSTIGIDDAVRPNGSVVFRVLGDDRKVLYESDLLRGTDAAEQIIVDIQNQQEMTLVVDFGDGLDLSDYADWADARFIKPLSALSSEGL